MSWKNAEAASEFMKRLANPNRRLIVRALALASKGAGATFGLSVAFTKSLEAVRMRMASSTLMMKIFPSPIRPVSFLVAFSTVIPAISWTNALGYFSH
jgi:DNA-binding transcriptional ArsR family regulator